MAIIKKPLNMFTIANKLGYYEYAPHPETGNTARKVDLGRLCTHGNINMWSKHKPVKLAQVQELDDNQFATLNYGLTPPLSSTNYENVVNKDWVYNKPSGGSQEPFRLSDFNKYYHGAIPIARIGRKAIEAYRSTNSTITVGLAINVNESDEQIGLGDLTGDIGTYFFGVIFKFGGNEFIQTAKKALGDTTTLGEFSDSFELNIQHPDFSSGSILNVEMIYVLSKNMVGNFTNLSSLQGNTYLPIPAAEGDSHTGSLKIYPAGTKGISTHDMYVGTSPGIKNLISNYNNMLGEAFVTRGDLYLGIILRATGTTKSTFEVGDISINLDTNYFGISQVLDIGIFEPDGTQITSTIDVYPNVDKLVYFGGTNIVNRMANGTIADPPSNMEIFPNIRIYRKGFLFTSTSLKLKSS